jgi:hypothetical protein
MVNTSFNQDEVALTFAKHVPPPGQIAEMIRTLAGG